MNNSPLIGLKIVVVGGGSGTRNTVKGLIKLPVSVTAICTVFDSGGSTGQLRRWYEDTLASGDMRNCMEALIPNDFWRAIFEYRFQNGTDSPALDNQAVGNMIIKAAQDIYGKAEGMKLLEGHLNLRGSVVPVSTDIAHLNAKLSDGTILYSEAAIDTREPKDPRTIQNIFLDCEAIISLDATNALLDADIIVFGPGDHFSSLLPNFLVQGFSEAIRKSNALVIYVGSLMTKPQETKGYTLRPFIDDLFAYGFGRECLDAVIVNSNIPGNGIAKRYHVDDSVPVSLDETTRQHFEGGKVVTFVERDLISREDYKQGFIRHDPEKLAQVIIGQRRSL